MGIHCDKTFHFEHLFLTLKFDLLLKNFFLDCDIET